MSAWLEHVKKTKKENPEVFKKEKLKGILKLASKTYKKGSSSASKKTSKSKKRGGGRISPIHQTDSEPLAHHGNSSLSMLETATQLHKGGKKRRRNKSRKGRKTTRTKSRKTRRRRSRK